MQRIFWDSACNPRDISFNMLLYKLREEDGDNPLLLDAVTVDEIIADSEGEIAAFDALVTPYSKLERRMNVLMAVMGRAGTEVKPLALQVTAPFKNRGMTNVAAVFELSDGQTISVFFHNPDTTPNRLAPTDEMISWKWLLNKKDVTIVVAPERGKDLNVHEVARRLMKLADKNSAAFARANQRRAERLKAIEDAKTAVSNKENELASLMKEIEAARVELEDKKIKRDTAKLAFDAHQAQKAKEEADRKAAEEAARKAAEEEAKAAQEAARLEEEKRQAEEAAQAQSKEIKPQPQTPETTAAEAAGRLIGATDQPQGKQETAQRANAVVGDVSRIVRMFADANDPKQREIATKLEEYLSYPDVRTWWDPFRKRMTIGKTMDDEKLVYVGFSAAAGSVYVGGLDADDEGLIKIPADYAKKIIEAVNPKGFTGELTPDATKSVPASPNPIVKDGEPVAGQAAVPGAGDANDLDIEADKKTLQSIIDKTHPKIQSADLFSDIELLWNRYDGKNAEMMELINQAINVWGEVANELTKNLS